jgi:hypothetical protein
MRPDQLNPSIGRSGMTEEGGDKLSDDEIKSNPPGYTASEAMEGDTDQDDQDSDSDDTDSDSDA